MTINERCNTSVSTPQPFLRVALPCLNQIDTYTVAALLSSQLLWRSLGPTSRQLSEIRAKHNLEDSGVIDLVKSCCCTCCALIQAKKESREFLCANTGHMDGVVEEEYVASVGSTDMVYEPKPQLQGEAEQRVGCVAC
jgi:Cys-rich protein (TIGR01571 family)